MGLATLFTRVETASRRSGVWTGVRNQGAIMHDKAGGGKDGIEHSLERSMCRKRAASTEEEVQTGELDVANPEPAQGAE